MDWLRIVFPVSFYQVRSSLDPAIPRPIHKPLVVGIFATALGAFAAATVLFLSKTETFTQIATRASELEAEGYTCKSLNGITDTTIQIGFLSINGYFAFPRMEIGGGLEFKTQQQCYDVVTPVLGTCEGWQKYYSFDSTFTANQLFNYNDQIKVYPGSNPPLPSPTSWCPGTNNASLNLLLDMVDRVCSLFKTDALPPYYCTREMGAHTKSAALNLSLNVFDLTLMVCFTLLFAGLLVVFLMSDREKAFRLLISEEFFDYKTTLAMVLNERHALFVLLTSVVGAIAAGAIAYVLYSPEKIKSIYYANELRDNSCSRVRAINGDEVKWLASYSKQNNMHENLFQFGFDRFYNSNTSGSCSNTMSDPSCYFTYYFDATGDANFFPKQQDCLYDFTDERTTNLTDCSLSSITVSLGYSYIKCKLQYARGSKPINFVLTYTPPSAPIDSEALWSSFIGAGYNTIIANDFCDYFEDGNFPPYECSEESPKYNILSLIALVFSLAKLISLLTGFILTRILSLFGPPQANVKKVAAADKVTNLLTPISLFVPPRNIGSNVKYGVALAASLFISVGTLAVWIGFAYNSLTKSSPMMKTMSSNDGNVTLHNECYFVGTTWGESTTGSFVISDDNVYMSVFGAIYFPNYGSCVRKVEATYCNLTNYFISLDNPVADDFYILNGSLEDPLAVSIREDYNATTWEDSCKAGFISGMCSHFLEGNSVCNIQEKPQKDLLQAAAQATAISGIFHFLCILICSRVFETFAIFQKRRRGSSVASRPSAATTDFPTLGSTMPRTSAGVKPL